MNNKTNIVDSVLITIGTLFGITEIESLMGVIVLCVQILWICIKCGIKVVEHIKNKDTKKAITEIDETITTITDLTKKDELKDGNK